ncbi:hypothetical protein B0H12DRAFT_471379 [Mycena haematopus]|nr:hypothetical protein B0H12DRAFT_471379 [Mycena haematopus]
MTQWKTLLDTAACDDTEEGDAMVDGVRTSSEDDLSAIIGLEDRTLAIRYRTPPITFGEKCLHHFMVFVVGNATSAIRQYNSDSSEGSFYFASVGNEENLRWASVVLPGSASIQAITKEFHAQVGDPVLSRTVYNHGRFIVDKYTPFESKWQSRFTTIRKRYGGVEFDWVTALDDNLWLPRRRQLAMTLDHTYMSRNDGFNQILDVLAPFLAIATQKLLVEYLIAVLAVICKLPTVEEKLVYLAHQRTYLDNRMEIERDFDSCIYTREQRLKLYQQGLKQNAHLFETISKLVNNCNGYPSLEQATAAEEFGFNMAQWDMGTYRYLAALQDQQADTGAIRMANSLKFNAQIAPHRAALKAAIFPALDTSFIEPEYTVYGFQTRVKFEKFHRGELRILPDLSSDLAALPAARVF